MRPPGLTETGNTNHHNLYSLWSISISTKIFVTKYYFQCSRLMFSPGWCFYQLGRHGTWWDLLVAMRPVEAAWPGLASMSWVALSTTTTNHYYQPPVTDIIVSVMSLRICTLYHPDVIHWAMRDIHQTIKPHHPPSLLTKTNLIHHHQTQMVNFNIRVRW